MEEKTINERESIDIITSMINRTRQRYMLGDGNIMLMWGYLTAAVSTLIWILLALTHNPAANWLWFLIGIIGGIATPIMAKRQNIQSGVKSYSDGIVSQIWTLVGVSAMAATIICIVFSLVTGTPRVWDMMFVIALIIVPMAEIAQGIVIREKSFIFGGSIGLLGGMFTLCCVAASIPLQISWFMPMFIGIYVCMMIIPGYTLNYKAKHAAK